MRRHADDAEVTRDLARTQDTPDFEWQRQCLLADEPECPECFFIDFPGRARAWARPVPRAPN